MELVTMMLANMAAKEAREREEEQSERRRTGNYLRDLRNALNVNQQFLAERMGISVGRLERLENGRDCNDWKLLVKCCELALTFFMSGTNLEIMTAENWREYMPETRDIPRRRGRSVI